MKKISFLLLFIATKAFATSVCIDSPSTNIRTAPNSKAKVLWTALKYSPFVYVKQQGAWLQVRDMDGQLGWVSSQNITQKYRCAAIKTQLTMTYTEPNPSKADKMHLRLDRYWPLKRLDKLDSWYKVEDHTRKVFWVREDDIWLPIKEVSFDL